jgi:hypothetical protein
MPPLLSLLLTLLIFLIQWEIWWYYFVGLVNKIHSPKFIHDKNMLVG